MPPEKIDVSEFVEGLTQADPSDRPLPFVAETVDPPAEYDYDSFELFMAPFYEVDGQLLDEETYRMSARGTDFVSRNFESAPFAAFQIYARLLGGLEAALLLANRSHATLTVVSEEDLLRNLYSSSTSLLRITVVEGAQAVLNGTLQIGLAPMLQRLVSRYHQTARAYEPYLLAGLEAGYHAGGRMSDFLTECRIEASRLDPLVRGETPAKVDYDFHRYRAGSVNFGLRLIWSQTWKPLGAQTGEIVRTIPLGPGQTEKVTIRTQRRRKQASTAERLAESESSFESSRSAEDSSEVVEEAKKSSEFDLGVSASANFGPFGSAETSLNHRQNSESTSRNTTKSVASSTDKSSRKINRKRKISISTEIETGFETERYSELVNSNAELPVTWEFYERQNLYETFTRMTSAEAVILTAEAVPERLTIDGAWVRKHQVALSRALIDESYRPTLEGLVNDVEPEPPGGDEDTSSMLGAAVSRFGQFTTDGTGPGQGGLSLDDIYAEPQRQRRDFRGEQRIHNAELRRQMQARGMFLEHLRDNILHYCRAIWSAEDPDQRKLRYQKEKRRVPDRFVRSILFGRVPESERDLTDYIDLTGPVGFVGNYAVFNVRADALLRLGLQDGEPRIAGRFGGIIEVIKFREDLWDVLSTMLDPYVDGQTGLFRDPARDAFLAEADDVEDEVLATLDDATIRDLILHVPAAADTLLAADLTILRGDDKRLEAPPSKALWGEYLYQLNGTRRVLVGTNNLYLRLRVGEGVALEPFKRAHRMVDVQRAADDAQTVRLKNARRTQFLEVADQLDPDVAKVVVVRDAVSVAGVVGGETDPEPPNDGDREDEP